MVQSALRPGGGTTAWSRLRASWADKLPLPCIVCGLVIQPEMKWHLHHPIPRKHGGEDRDARPAHAACNLHAGATPFFSAPKSSQTRPAFPALSPSVGGDPAIEGLAPDDPTWNRAPWLDSLRTVPPEASWPRLMTAPHPRAVGSYGDEFAAFAEMRTGRPLRWWQRLVATRLLEYDAAGSLVWLVLLLTMARQVGKSWLLREFCVWRIHQADRYGEEQLVINTGKDISVCKEVQRPARAWAKERKALGYDVREANGQEEISTPDGSRWMLRARESVYGYSASAAAVDEAWAVSPGAVEDGLEPTMPERAQPQLLLVSTAHRKATPLMVMRRADALASLQTPTDVLLIEWSAPPGADVADRSAWRAASPYWSDRRERLIESSLRRALGGATDDPWEDDPLEAFRSQWLNVWPQHAVGASANDEALLDEGVWAGLIDRGVMPTGELVLALEDWYGTGAAAAAASRLDDGRVMVWGATFARRAGAVAWLTQLAELHPGSRLRVGASLERSEELVGIPVEGIEGCGLAQTRTSLSGLRELVADDRLIHDGGIDLDGQLRGLRVVRTTLGLSVSLRSGRHDLAKCAAWAAASAAQAAVTESAIF